MPDQFWAMFGRIGGDINRQAVAVGQCAYTLDMIAMFMRYKNGFYFLHRKSQPLHPLFCFPARDAGIYQNRIGIVAHIIAIAVAAGIKGCDE